MRKLKGLILAITVGLALALSGCSEEVIMPDGDTTGTTTQNDPDD